MPQGGIDEGERPIDAAVRELREETSATAVHLLAESRWWYAYALPLEITEVPWRGRWPGQTQRWFAFGFEGRNADLRVDGHEVEFVDWRWAWPNEVLDLVVDFKRPVYRQVLDEFRPVLVPPNDCSDAPAD